MRRTTTRTELLRTVSFTTNELIAIGAAITLYRKWLTCTPESAIEHRDMIALLDRFQKRLTIPSSYTQEAML